MEKLEVGSLLSYTTIDPETGHRILQKYQVTKVDPNNPRVFEVKFWGFVDIDKWEELAKENKDV